jgi:hypothetical protein
MCWWRGRLILAILSEATLDLICGKSLARRAGESSVKLFIRDRMPVKVGEFFPNYEKCGYKSGLENIPLAAVSFAFCISATFFSFDSAIWNDTVL